MNRGTYASHKGVNFPKTELSVPALTEKDLQDLAFILTQNAHFIALSFVRRPEDLIQLKQNVGQSSQKVRIIAKIEKPQAAARIDEILTVCDGIMVARGDLGVEMSLAQVPTLQKDLIHQANQAGKTVIVATQMLESMIQHYNPTRAEVSDVANAILDGTDAVMLSGETATGQYPVETVETMREIISATESSSYYKRTPVDLTLSGRNVSHAMCEAAAWASRDLQDIPILIFTLSGETAWYMSKIRPQAPIWAFSPDSVVVAQLALAWNTRAFQIPFEGDLNRLIGIAEKKLVQAGVVKDTAQIVIVSGTLPLKGATNFVRVKPVGDK